MLSNDDLAGERWASFGLKDKLQITRLRNWFGRNCNTSALFLSPVVR